MVLARVKVSAAIPRLVPLVTTGVRLSGVVDHSLAVVRILTLTQESSNPSAQFYRVLISMQYTCASNFNGRRIQYDKYDSFANVRDPRMRR